MKTRPRTMRRICRKSPARRRGGTPARWRFDKSRMNKIIREIIAENATNDPPRITKPAVAALRIAAEAYLVGYLQDAYVTALSGGKKTLRLEHLALTAYMRHDHGSSSEAALEHVTPKRKVKPTE